MTMTNIEDRTKREVRKFLKSLTPEQSRCFGKFMYSLLDAAGGDPKDPVLLNAVGQIGMAMRKATST
jgi:hypothetical protein